MFGKKASRPLRQLFSETFKHLIVNTNVFPDPEEVNVEASLSREDLDHLIFDELALTFIIIRLEIGAKKEFRNNLVHVHEEFFAGLIEALDEFKDALPGQSFLEAVGSYEQALDFEAEITEQLVSCYNVFSTRMNSTQPGYNSLLTLVKYIRLHVAQPLIKSAESQFKFE